MSKSLLLAAALVAASFAPACLAPACAESLPSGAWMRGDGGAKVRLYPCGGALCAKNIWVRDPAGDEKVGDVLVLQVRLQKAQGGRLYAGTAYDPRHKATYDLQMQVGANSIDTRGCVMGGSMCKSLSWSRL